MNRALRMAIYRQWDRMYSQGCEPGFTGEITIRLNFKAGRPGQPRFTTELYGVSS